MNNKYIVRALKIEDDKWKAKYLNPQGSVVNNIVMLPEPQYPFFEILFKTEHEANQAAYKYLTDKGVMPEEIEVKTLEN